MITLNQEVELEVFSELCCDECNEIIHNHIDCPICEKYTGTDQYHCIDDHKEIQCTDCGSIFRKITDSWFDECLAMVVKIGNKF